MLGRKEPVGRIMSDHKPPFATIEEAIEDIRQGRMIVLVDDEDRENEGDLTMAAEKVTPEAINFMAKYGRGLICITMTEQRCELAGARADFAAQHFGLWNAFLRTDRRAPAAPPREQALPIGPPQFSRQPIRRLGRKI